MKAVVGDFDWIVPTHVVRHLPPPDGLRQLALVDTDGVVCFVAQVTGSSRSVDGRWTWHFGLVLGLGNVIRVGWRAGVFTIPAAESARIARSAHLWSVERVFEDREAAFAASCACGQWHQRRASSLGRAHAAGLAHARSRVVVHT